MIIRKIQTIKTNSNTNNINYHFREDLKVQVHQDSRYAMKTI